MTTQDTATLHPIAADVRHFSPPQCKQQVAVLTTGDIGSEVAPMILRRGLRKVTVSLRRTNEIVQMMRPEQRPDGVVLSQAEA